MPRLITAALATLVLGTSLVSPTGAFAQPGHHGSVFHSGASAGGMHHFAGGWQHRHAFRSGPSYYGGSHGYPGYGYGYDDGYDPGAAIAGGVIGLAAGAVLGGALPQGNSVRWCEAHYRSYDLGSRTFLGNDGLRHPCPA